MVYLPVIFILPYYASQSLQFSNIKLVTLFALGIFIWTFVEYILHRFVFHHHPETPDGKKINYIFHGNHHEFPKAKSRLFMPLVPSLLISSLFFMFFYSFFNMNVFVLFPGFMLGYLIYGSMHYAIHAWNPPFRWMKPLWRNHYLHHYKDGDFGFGVSNTFWDRVFGTMYETKKEKMDKEKIKKLKF
jgi:sterol desaturase/sphingolipid hydroxylase (fatty acid hydroxylase superfamily)